MSNGKIRKLETQRAAERKEAIKLLEDTLESAKAESVQAVALVTVYVDGSVGTGYVSGDMFYQLLGGLSEIQSRMFVDARQEDGSL